MASEMVRSIPEIKSLLKLDSMVRENMGMAWARMPSGRNVMPTSVI
jgi:hypothetical protein